LLTGKSKEITAHQNEDYEEANIQEIPAEFIYYQDRKDEYWFRNSENPSDRMFLNSEAVGDLKNYLKKDLQIKLIKFKDEIISLDIPVKIDYKVISAPPAVEGNTATGGTKRVTIETGHKINTPLFIEKGDIIKVNTKTDDYTERVSKK
jgi:elongation factor P